MYEYQDQTEFSIYKESALRDALFINYGMPKTISLPPLMAYGSGTEDNFSVGYHNKTQF